MRAMVLRGKELAVEEVARPVPGPGEVLCRVLACGVCGSDLHVAQYAWDMQQEQRAKGMPLLGNMDLEAGVVMGAGPIGMMTLLWLKREGAGHVTVSEPSRERRELAAKVGADLVVDPRSEDVAERMRESGGEPTVVFECVGVEGTLQQAMELTARRGRVIVVGVCMVDDHLQPRVGIMKHLTLQFVLGCTPEEYAEVLAAFASGEVDPSPLVTKRVSLDDLPATFRALSDPKDCLVVFAP